MASGKPSCYRCRNPAYTRVPGATTLICRKCYSTGIVDRVRRTINRYQMFHDGDVIAVGLSGGKDSTVLLHILSQLEKSHPSSSLTAIAIDEGIHGYRDEAIKYAQRAAEKAAVELYLVSFEELFGYTLDELALRLTNANSSKKPCAICGNLRRYALNRVARGFGATKLATGHNLDDEAQTCILNMLRGDLFRFRRLSRKPMQKHPQLVPRVKPLVELTEREIQLYALAKEIQYHDFECPYALTAMRNDVRSFLATQEEKRAGTLITILRFHDRLVAQKNGEMGPRFKPCKKCGEPTSTETCSACKILEKLGS
ncbi:MAG: TIGR00269 family protein [Candidatus Hodarchaeota archaeon]